MACKCAERRKAWKAARDAAKRRGRKVVPAVIDATLAVLDKIKKVDAPADAGVSVLEDR